jgi:hypothetical protein
VPHVILEGSVSIADLQGRHAPFTVREGDRVVKCDRFFAESTGRAALVETIVVEHGHAQKFFIQIAAREGGLTVRLEPMTDPEKSPGVKRALALVAGRIREAFGLRFGSTNIAGFLPGPGGKEGEPG